MVIRAGPVIIVVSRPGPSTNRKALKSRRVMDDLS